MSNHAELVADIPFDQPLAAMDFLAEGWCEPEENFSWTVGTHSRLTLELPRGHGPYVLILQGHPYLHPPGLTRQRLGVAANGADVASLLVDGLFTERVRIPAGIIKGRQASIVFSHPDSESPARHGSTDTRRLGIRFWHIRLFRISKIKPARRKSNNAPAGVAQQLDALARLAKLTDGETDLCRRLKAGGVVENPALDLAFRKLFLECLTHGYCVAASEMARRAAGDGRVSVTFDGTAGTDHSVVRFTKTADGACVFGISPTLLGAVDGVATPMAVWHLLAALPMFCRYAQSDAPAGTCFVNLGDEGHARGVAFCNVRSMDTLLVPDPYFLASRGYAAFRHTDVPWQERRDVALWRGASTGYRAGANVLDLPRVKLCGLGALPENAPYLDVGMTGMAQLQSAAEADLLRRIGAMRDFVPAERFQEWKYTIDIDGNTNSWPGLFRKLLSGSVVLKVASGGPYSQWYYDRLKPFENFVPVANDMSDLVEKIRILRANDGLARSIGAAGRALALSMELDTEIEAAMAVIETAV